MHIGFLTLESPYDSSRGGGIAAYLRAVIPELVQVGHRVTVIANAQEDGEAVVDDSVRLINVRLPNWHWYAAKLPLFGDALALPLRQFEWSLSFSRAAVRLMEHDPMDVLESTEVGALLVARRPPARLVMRLHGSDYTFRKYTGQPLHRGTRWNHRLEQWACRQAHALTTPSRFHAAEVRGGLGCHPEGVRVIPNPIAPDVLAEALLQGADTCAARPNPIILYTGRLAAVKGITPLLEAARLVRERTPSARFVLAGPWQMPHAPQSWGLVEGAAADGAGIGWLGHVPWRQLIEWYRRASVFAMPSYYETFGISCLEAMAFGLPVVATTAGGLPEVVEDGVTGLLVPPGDAPAMAEAVGRLLQDADLRCRLGAAGRERVLARFTAESVVEQTLRVYQGVQSTRLAA